MNIDRLPPHSPEGEAGVLGCCMLAPKDCIPLCIEKLAGVSEFFYDPRNQIIYEALVELYNAPRVVDLITVIHHLEGKKLLEQIGGISYINSLDDNVPTAAHLPWYLEIVIGKYLLRRLMQTCTEIVGRIYDFTGDVSSLVDEAERDILAVRSLKQVGDGPTVKELVSQAMEDIEGMGRRKDSVDGLPTGLTDYDAMTGGMHEGEMIVIGGFPSTGKTSLMMNIAEHVAVDQNHPVGVFSLEMPSRKIVARLLCCRAKVDKKHIRAGDLNQTELSRLVGAAAQIANSNFHFCDIRDMTVYQIRAKARRMSQQFGIKLFVVDYLQRISGVGGGFRTDTREQEIARVSDGLKSMSLELSAPVLVGSQLNDDGKVRDSRAIGQDVDTLAMIEPGKDDNEQEDAVPVVLRIKKQRDGPKGKINLTFLKPYTKFESAAKISDEDAPPQTRSMFPEDDK